MPTGGRGGGGTSIGSFVTSNKTRKRRVSFRGEPRNAHNANCQDHDNVLIRVSEVIVIRVLKYVLFYVERVSKSLCLESFVTIREQGRLIKATSTLLISWKFAPSHPPPPPPVEKSWLCQWLCVRGYIIMILNLMNKVDIWLPKNGF